MNFHVKYVDRRKKQNVFVRVLGYNTGYLAVCTTLGLGKLYRRQNFKQGLPDYLIILLIRMLLYYCFHIMPDQPSAIKPKVNTVPLDLL